MLVLEPCLDTTQLTIGFFEGGLDRELGTLRIVTLYARTIYFGGYDATGGTNEHDKAWIMSAGWDEWPALTITRPDPPAFQLSWPATSLDWQLEASVDLGSTAAWQPVAAQPTRSLMGTTQSISPAAPREFFRLRKP